MNLGDAHPQLFSDLPAEFEPGPHLVYLLTPWGQQMWVQYLEGEWEMLHKLAQMQDVPVERVIEELERDKFIKRLSGEL